MMLLSVPLAISEWLGTRNGDSSTVDLLAQDNVTTLVPYDRKAVFLQNPATSRADNGRSLGMREFQLLYRNTPVQSSPDFILVRFLK
jgi:hypothetical protein